MEWRRSGEVEWLEARLPAARAAFSTRSAGSVRESREPLARALELDPERIAMGRQVHGAELAVHSDPGARNQIQELGDDLPEVDGHVTSQPRLPLLVFAADCLPVALSGPGGVAVLHCGWRGLAAGIVARGVAAVGATAAAIGPGIGPCCYEVGDEVLGAFAGLGDSVARGAMLDLPEVARRQLRSAGVADVQSAGLCTSCEAGRFFSHRREGERAGRQAGLAWIDAGGEG